MTEFLPLWMAFVIREHDVRSTGAEWWVVEI